MLKMAIISKLIIIVVRKESACSRMFFFTTLVRTFIFITNLGYLNFAMVASTCLKYFYNHPNPIKELA